MPITESIFPGAPSGEEISAAVESLRGIVYAVTLCNLDTGDAELLYGKESSATGDLLAKGSADDKIRKYIERYVPEYGREALRKAVNADTLRAALSRGEKRLEVVYPRRFDNGISYVSASLTLSRGLMGARTAIAMFQNINELLSLRARAESDTLTGLLNREGAEERIQEALDRLQEGDSGSFIFFDVDNLKRINDNYGHPSGDEALRRIASAMRNTFRRTTDLICRISGDEFVVWMPGMADAGLVERKIMEMHDMLGARRRGEKAIPLSFSVGAAFARPGDTFTCLYALTDEALYRAKDKGKGICVFVARDARPADAGALSPSENDAAGDKPLLLVVDDTAIHRCMLRQIFTEHYGVLEACDGAEALSLLKAYGARIEAMLLDMVMPGMSGEALLRVLDENGTLEKLPVIVLSADTNQEKVSKALSLGADDFVSKPFIPSLLQRKVRIITDLYRKNRLEN